MTEKLMQENVERTKITFGANIEFDGSASEFEKVLEDLVKLRQRGLMIDTVPLPEKTGSRMMIDSVPLPEFKGEGLKIGTWPTPEHKTNTLMIDTVPLPEMPPFPGIPPIVKLLSKEMINRLAKGMPRLKINKDIYGGIRNPHFHLGNDLVLLDQARFKELVGHVAMEMAKGLVKP